MVEDAERWGQTHITSYGRKFVADMQRMLEEWTQAEIAEYRRLGYVELDMFTTTKEQFLEFQERIEGQRIGLYNKLVANHPEWINVDTLMISTPYASPKHLRKMHKTELDRISLEI